MHDVQNGDFKYRIFRLCFWSFCSKIAAKGQTNPYLPIINNCIISKNFYLVNKLLQNFNLNFTFCASRTEACVRFRDLAQNVVAVRFSADRRFVTVLPERSGGILPCLSPVPCHLVLA